MLRLILLVAFVAVLAIALIVAMGMIKTVADAATGKETEDMPAKFQRITYVLLVVLLFGVASGWLGGT